MMEKKIRNIIEHMTYSEFKNMYKNVGLPTQSYSLEKYSLMLRTYGIWFRSLTVHNQEKIYDYVKTHKM